MRDSRNSKKGEIKISKEEMDQIVARARKAGEERMKGYRERSLKIHPWICSRCGREFNHKNIHMLTVHHKDHNHDNNPADGSNWENLCVYCHDNEHRRYLDYVEGGEIEKIEGSTERVTQKPFAVLGDLLKKKK